MKQTINRRGFIGAGAMFAVAGCQSWKGGAPAITAVRSPNGRLRHMSIGCANMAGGDIASLDAWMQEKVFRHGRALSAPELLKRATGTELDAGAYLEYLNEKFARR